MNFENEPIALEECERILYNEYDSDINYQIVVASVLYWEEKLKEKNVISVATRVPNQLISKGEFN